MKWGEHEYKTMGLAPYSTNFHSDGPFEIFNNTLSIIDYKTVKQNLKDCYFFLKNLYQNIDLMVLRKGYKDLPKKNSKWFKLWINKTKIYDICYSGGVSMNVKQTRRLAK